MSRQRTWVTFVAAVVGVPALALGCLAAYGAFLVPREHVASKEVELPMPPEQLFDVVTHFEQYPCWRTGVEKIELSEDGFEEFGAEGSMRYVVEESRAPDLLRTRIADETLPFGGTWTYEIEAKGEGSMLRITEHGFIENVMFRAGASFFMDPTASMTLVQQDLTERGAECAKSMPSD